jgi:putative SOS response-associated peptidase YedK
MCGRYASTRDPARLAAEFDALDATGSDAPRADYNVAPTKKVVSVVQRHPRDAAGNRDMTCTERSLRIMRWGLVPKWAKDPAMGSRLINARAETVTGKPAFRGAIKHQRCLLPADGWYEWQRDGKRKIPYFMTPRDGSGLAFAGLWSTWRDPNAEGDALPLVTCAVLTTDAVGPLVEVHERMPLVLPQSAWSQWLDPDLDSVADLLTPPSADEVAQLEIRPVSSAVNNVRNNGPELTELRAEEEFPALLERVALDGERAESG